MLHHHAGSVSACDAQTNRAAFFRWLSKQQLSSQAINPSDLYEEVEVFCSQRELISKPLFQIMNLSEITALQNRLKTSRLYHLFYREKTTRIIVALSHYAQYLQELNQPAAQPSNVSAPSGDVAQPNAQPSAAASHGKEPAPSPSQAPAEVAPAIDASTTQEKQQSQSPIARFQAYLKKEGCNEQRIHLMVRAVAMAEKLGVGNLYAADNAQEVLLTFNTLLMDDAFIKANRKSNGLLIYSIQQYLKMLKPTVPTTSTTRPTPKPASPTASQPTTQQPLVKAHQDAPVTVSKSAPNAPTSSPDALQRPTSPTAQPAKASIDEAAKPQPDAITAALDAKGFSYIDERPQGGHLWLPDNKAYYLFIVECKDKGITFRYCPREIDKPSERHGWYLVENNAARAKKPVAKTTDAPAVSTISTRASDQNKLSDELQQLLADDDFAPLRAKLIEKDILTLPQLKETNLWIFMNLHSLYSLAKRQEVYTRVARSLKGKTASKPNHSLQTPGASYDGATPAPSQAPAEEAPATDSSATQEKQQSQSPVTRFQAHLKKEGYSEQRIHLMVRAVDMVKKRGFGNLYAADNAQEALLLLNTLLTDSTFVNADRKSGGLMVQSIQKYVEMLKTIAAVSNAQSASDTYSNPLSEEVQRLLADDDLGWLRAELVRHKVLTLSQLKECNLWKFMNLHGLYSIGTRQEINTRIMRRLNAISEPSCGSEYTLKTLHAAYSGGTPAEAFVAYCEHLARQYPYSMRVLRGFRYGETESVILSLSDKTGTMLKLPNMTAYVSPALTVQEAVDFAIWLCAKCGDADMPTAMTEDGSLRASAQAEPAPDEGRQKPVIHREVQEKPSISSLPSIHPPANPKAQHASSTPREVQKKPSIPSFPSIQPHTDPQTHASPTHIKAAEAVVLESDLAGMTINEFSKRMRLNTAAAKKLVADAPHIVMLNDRLIHEEAFADWADGADQLEAIIEKLMAKNDGYVSSMQLYALARADMHMFLNDNDIDNEKAVYDMAQHLFEKAAYHGKRFAFEGRSHISRKDAGEVRSVLDIISKFAREQGGCFTAEDLENHLARLGLSTANLRLQMHVYTEPLYLLYNDDTYLSAESMGMDDQWFDATAQALRRLFADVGDHIVLRDIQPWWYTQLPALPGNKPWTPLLLQDVLRHYGRRLHAHTLLAIPRQAIDTLHAMVVQDGGEVQTFCDAVAVYIADEVVDQRTFAAEELRQMLVKRGMLAGNELIYNMPKALKNDERFAWDAAREYVTVRV